jgi:CheY-like chemotaxis protein
VANAVKFTSHGGRVDVDAGRSGSMARIVVTDTGRGIGAADLSRIFDRVWPVSSAITRRHRGLGLGLAVVYQLVKLHGGSVVAESAGLGQGATFAVEIPLVSPARDFDVGRPRAAPGDLSGLRLLVVDDEVDAIEAASALLRHWGAEVRTVSSAEEALGVLADFSPHVLISDLAMPRHDGYALMLAIRENESRTGAPRLPAIALTAHSREQERRKAIASGFDAVVSKPIESGELLDTLGILVGRP